MDSTREALNSAIQCVHRIQGLLSDLQAISSASDHRADWREYIQQREHFADRPIPVVPLMVARPGATEPGMFPTDEAERAEAEAQVAEHRRLARDNARKQYARKRVRRERVAANTKELSLGQYHETFHSAVR